MKAPTSKVLTTNVVVAALGYFVDIYDLLLFGIVRVSSLKSIGVADDKLLENGVYLINMQMIGMLIGGLLWGVIGDKKGRISVLFGSIFLYSIANILNAFVSNVDQYGVLRFVAGVGLAGELGAAITLVSETMTKETRGYGTTVVASVGILGAVVASLVGDAFSWQTAYIIGGVMGLFLLLLRVSMYESGLFASAKKSTVKKGDISMLFSPLPRFIKYLRCILIGIPVWFIVGILLTFSPELTQALGVQGTVTASKAIMFGYMGLSAGDFASGFISQKLGSRRKVVGAFLFFALVLSIVYYFSHGISNILFYTLCVGLGFGAGYWAVFVTNAAEQFGTNLRATVTTSVPNFVRGSVVLLTLSFKTLSGSLGLLNAALTVGLISFAIAFLALWFMQETYGKDLDYFEEL
jgi:MFS transporter, putative metabolite:H+ symporter